MLNHLYLCIIEAKKEREHHKRREEKDKKMSQALHIWEDEILTNWSIRYHDTYVSKHVLFLNDENDHNYYLGLKIEEHMNYGCKGFHQDAESAFGCLL